MDSFSGLGSMDPVKEKIKQHWIKAAVGMVVSAIGVGGTYAGSMIVDHESQLAGIVASSKAHKEALEAHKKSLDAQIAATKDMKKDILKAIDDNKAAVSGAVAETRMRAKEDADDLKEQVQRMDAKIEKLQWRVIREMKGR